MSRVLAGGCALVVLGTAGGVSAQDFRYETTVVATDRPVATASEREVDGQSLQLTPHHDAADLLVLVPGLLVGQHGGEGKAPQIFLRGFDAVHGSDVEIAVDGLPVNELSNVHGQGYLDLGFVIPEAVLRLKAMKGPFRVEQGNFATAGSVELELGVPRAQRGTRASFELGTTGRQRGLFLHAPPSAGEDEVLAVELMRDPGFGENRASERASGLAAWRIGRFRLLASAYAARFGTPGALPAALVDEMGFLAAPSPDTEGSSARSWLALAHRSGDEQGFLDSRVWLSARDLVLEENFTGFLLDAERGDRREQRHRAFGGGARVRGEKRLIRGLRLVAGGNLLVESFAQGEDRIDASHVAWQENRRLDGAQAAAGAYLGARWRARPWLKLDGGVRADGFVFAVGEEDAIGQLSPRLAVSLPVLASWTFFASAGRGVRAPEARAVGRDGRPDVELDQYDGGPARSTAADALEAGVRWRPREGLEVALAGFATWIAGELVFDHVSGVNVELNETRRLGGEAELAFAPLPWLALRADATLVDAGFVGSGAPIPGAPTALATLEAQARWQAFRLGLRGTLLGPRPLAHGARASGSSIVDLVAGWRGERLEVGLAVDNLFDAEWRESEFHYASWFDRSRPRSQLPAAHFVPGEPLALRATLTAYF